MEYGRKIVFIDVLLFSILFAFSGCDDDFNKVVDKMNLESARHSSVSKSMGELKESGLLDSLINYQSTRSVVSSDLYDDNIEQINRFIFNTDEVLDEIAKMENGEVQLRLIEALFTGGSVGEIIDIMAEISEDMAIDFNNAIENNFGSLYESSAFSSRSVTSSGNINDIRLNFYKRNNSRGAYDANLDNSTINWYIGFCAATTAGVYAASSKVLWVSIPGIVVATAGAVSMGVQIVRWTNCADFLNFVNSMKYKNYTNAAMILNDSPSIQKIALSTVTTAVLIAVSPVGKVVIAALRDAWSTFIATIQRGTSVILTYPIVKF